MLSLFKPKPMISVVLTKTTDDEKDKLDFSRLEHRLDQIGRQIKKIKKRSMQIGENDNTGSSIPEVPKCCVQPKRKSCLKKPTKPVRVAARQSKTCKSKVGSPKQRKSETCPLKRRPIEDCTIDSLLSFDDDFSCGDVMNLSSDSDFGLDESCEGAAEVRDQELEDCLANGDEDVCEEEEKPCEEEKDSCEEVDEDESAKENNCTQVMSVAHHGSNYKVSQTAIEKEQTKSVKSVTSCTKTGSGDPVSDVKEVNALGGVLSSAKGRWKIGKRSKRLANKGTSTIPVITTTPASISSKSLDSKTSNQIDKGVVTEVCHAAAASFSAYAINNFSGEVETSIVSRATSVSPERWSSDTVTKNAEISIRSTGDESRNRSKVNGLKSSSVISLSKQRSSDNLTEIPHEFSVGKTESQKQSVLYFVRNSSNKTIPSLPNEGSIHIDASRVVIQNAEHGKIVFEQSGSDSVVNSKPIFLQQTSAGETVLSKLETKVSFQQPKVSESNTSRIKLSSIHSTTQELETISKLNTKSVMDSSTKIITSLAGPTSQLIASRNAEGSQSRCYCKEPKLSCDSNTVSVKPDGAQREMSIVCSLKVPKSNLSNVIDLEENLDRLSKESTAKDTSDTSNERRSTRSLDSSTNKSGFNAVKTSQMQFKSDSDTAQDRFVSNYDPAESQSRFASNCGMVKSSQDQNLSECYVSKTSRMRFSPFSTEAIKLSQVEVVSDCDAVKPTQGLTSDCDVMKPTQFQSFNDDPTKSQCTCNSRSGSTPLKSDSRSGELKSPEVRLVSNYDEIRNSQVRFISHCQLYVNDSGQLLIARSTPNNSRLQVDSKASNIGRDQSSKSTSWTQVYPSQFSSFWDQQSSGRQSRLIERDGGRASLSTTTTSTWTGTLEKQMVCVGSQTQETLVESNAQVSQGSQGPSKESVKQSFGENKPSNDCKEENRKNTSNQTCCSILSNDSKKVCDRASETNSILSKETASTLTDITGSSLSQISKNESSQPPETIVMQVKTKLEIPKNNDYLFVHCNKCKDICIAKIVEKTVKRDIWVEP